MANQGGETSGRGNSTPADSRHIEGLETIIVGLPALDGNLEVGIAAGVDKSLARDERLKIPKGKDVDVRKQAAYAAGRAAMRFVSSDPSAPVTFKDIFYVKGACLIVQSGLIGYADFDGKEAADGDWDEDNTSIDEAYKTKTAAILSSDKLSATDVMSVICATKVNMFLINHHTGQGSLQGYVMKLWKAKFAKSTGLGEGHEVQSMIHTIGHWAGTLRVLSHFKISGLRSSRPICPALTELKFAGDVSTRINSNTFPAGTHRTGVCYAGSKMILCSPMWPLFPDIADMSEVCTNAQAILANQAGHHTGGGYLCETGKAEYDDATRCKILGKVGSYITHVMSNHSLAKSPHIKKGGDKAYVSAGDYDEGWEVNCVTYSRSKVRVKSKFMETVLGTARGKLYDRGQLNAIRGQLGIPDVDEAEYNAIQDILIRCEDEAEEEAGSKGANVPGPPPRPSSATSSGSGSASGDGPEDAPGGDSTTGENKATE